MEEWCWALFLQKAILFQVFAGGCGVFSFRIPCHPHPWGIKAGCMEGLSFSPHFLLVLYCVLLSRFVVSCILPCCMYRLCDGYGAVKKNCSPPPRPPCQQILWGLFFGRKWLEWKLIAEIWVNRLSKKNVFQSLQNTSGRHLQYSYIMPFRFPTLAALRVE